MSKKKAPLDAGISAPGTHVLLNAWMTHTESYAREQVDAAVLAGDTGVYAVRYSYAKASEDLYVALKHCVKILEESCGLDNSRDGLALARQALRKAEEEA